MSIIRHTFVVSLIEGCTSIH